MNAADHHASEVEKHPQFRDVAISINVMVATASANVVSTVSELRPPSRRHRGPRVSTAPL
jgi:hypothetical protein